MGTSELDLTRKQDCFERFLYGLLCVETDNGEMAIWIVLQDVKRVNIAVCQA